MMEIGRHGYYHQTLTPTFEEHLGHERDMALESLQNNLGVRLWYLELPSYVYTTVVMRELVKGFDRVFSIAGTPLRPRNRVVHRLSLANPQVGGPFIVQIDRHTTKLRQLKTALVTSRPG